MKAIGADVCPFFHCCLNRCLMRCSPCQKGKLPLRIRALTASGVAPEKAGCFCCQGVVHPRYLCRERCPDLAVSHCPVASGSRALQWSSLSPDGYTAPFLPGWQQTNWAHGPGQRPRSSAAVSISSVDYLRRSKRLCLPELLPIEAKTWTRRSNLELRAGGSGRSSGTVR